ncbi:MAG TPA: 4-(cytidine 5'-diphospho)-2-C-methyl-D-erythritol kinase [Steroidobacteraceae bacterium]|nr:4-(cytidine 5'-diphospho)-2-C-methyl-D-erythritol kinase [Steroidobacteraceae bacterium]
METVTAARHLAPAKLNLFLHVTGRRADGYHDLQTVFQLIDLCDELTIRVRDDGDIRRDPPPDDELLAGLADADDLTVRAARLLQQASGTGEGASIHVRKCIPVGGGLGGGSSDAACVLRVLNRLWGLNWPAETLAELGLQVGSDVPVFVHGRSAFGAGRGELLTPLELPARWFLIVHPGIRIATREIFAAPDLTRDTPPLTIRSLPPDGGRNDCEPVVRARHPEVAAVLDRLAPHGARLSGTGACVFAAFGQRAAAEAAAQGLPAGWRTFVVRSLQNA